MMTEGLVAAGTAGLGRSRKPTLLSFPWTTLCLWVHRPELASANLVLVVEVGLDGFEKFFSPSWLCLVSLCYKKVP